MVQVQSIEDMGAYVKLVSSTMRVWSVSVDVDCGLIVARIRRHRGHDSPVRALETTNSVRSETHSCGSE